MTKPINWNNLQELYLKDSLSTVEIAQLKGCTSQGVIDAMRRQGIRVRSASEAISLAYITGRLKPIDQRGSKNHFYGGHQTAEAKRKISENTCQRLATGWREKLSKVMTKYWTEEKRQEHSQKLSGSNHPQFGIPKTEETKEKISASLMGRFAGADSPGWKGGIAYLPYTSNFNNRLKEEIRDRDSHICQLCGVPESECLIKLPIHHIDYDKGNGNKENLISLCNSCNSKTNFNREYWQVYFEKLIRKIYKGEETLA